MVVIRHDREVEDHEPRNGSDEATRKTTPETMDVDGIRETMTERTQFREVDWWNTSHDRGRRKGLVIAVKSLDGL